MELAVWRKGSAARLPGVSDLRVRLSRLRYELRRDWRHPDVEFGEHVLMHRGAVTRAKKPGQIKIGAHSEVEIGTLLDPYWGHIHLGERCFVGPNTVLYGHGGLTIGNNVLIAAQVVIVPSNHVFDDPQTPIREQGEVSQGIVVEDDVWIGAGVTVLDGAVIRRGAVIAAGAVVMGEIPVNAVAVNIPAQVAGYRGKDMGVRAREFRSN